MVAGGSSPADADQRLSWKSILAVFVTSMLLSVIAFGPLLLVGVGVVLLAGVKRITAKTSSAQRRSVMLGMHGLAGLMGLTVTFLIALAQTS